VSGCGQAPSESAGGSGLVAEPRTDGSGPLPGCGWGASPIAGGVDLGWQPLRHAFGVSRSSSNRLSPLQRGTRGGEPRAGLRARDSARATARHLDPRELPSTSREGVVAGFDSA